MKQRWSKNYGNTLLETKVFPPKNHWEIHMKTPKECFLLLQHYPPPPSSSSLSKLLFKYPKQLKYILKLYFSLKKIFLPSNYWITPTLLVKDSFDHWFVCAHVASAHAWIILLTRRVGVAQKFDEKGIFELKYSLMIYLSYFGQFRGNFYPFHFYFLKY